MKTILLLGSGELGKEFVIAVQRLGHRVVACDSYPDAPAMQVAYASRIFSMLDAEALDLAVAEIKPDIIVPEVEAIRTERLLAYEQQGYHVVPSAFAANTTMNRKAIRELAAQELQLTTAPYRYASTQEEFEQAVAEIGIPCVVKPLMSSSGKGQSTIRSADQILKAWEYALAGSRGDIMEVIVEGFIPFESEITLLTITQHHGETMFAPPIGHIQARGDYQESWMPHTLQPQLLAKAQEMAAAVTRALGGAGIWGVEFFVTANDIIFSELSPRPHDTGMVTLAGSCNLNEFELHARAVLGLPIPHITLERAAASAVILAPSDAQHIAPQVKGLENALDIPNVDVRIFGKPVMRPYRRMGVAVAYGTTTTPIEELRTKAVMAASLVTVV